MLSHLHYHQHGNIQLILGPMFSGKTSELFRRIQRYRIAKRSVLLVKYAKDQRYDENLASTHDLDKRVAISCYKLSELDSEILKDVDVIGIDEGVDLEIHSFT